MANLVIDTGLEEFVLQTKNGVETSIFYNPTDATFIEKVFSAFETLDEQQEAFQKKIENETDTKKLFSIMSDADGEMKALIDRTFEKEISNDLFGNMNVYALAGGLPLWANLFIAIIDTMQDTFAKEKKMTNPRLNKYIAKYKGR